MCLPVVYIVYVEYHVLLCIYYTSIYTGILSSVVQLLVGTARYCGVPTCTTYPSTSKAGWLADK